LQQIKLTKQKPISRKIKEKRKGSGYDMHLENLVVVTEAHCHRQSPKQQGVRPCVKWIKTREGKLG
jgi:hypothetical protein